MKILKLALAAALAVSGLTVTAAPAAATAAADQRGDRWDRDDNRRSYNRGQTTRRDRYRGHRGRHGYNRHLNRGRHHGWRNSRYRSCRTVWRYGQRHRVCRWIRRHR